MASSVARFACLSASTSAGVTVRPCSLASGQIEGLKIKFRIQFLGSPTVPSTAVLEERDLLAANAGEAAEAVATEPWPPEGSRIPSG
jgi:hypothetical protein